MNRTDDQIDAIVLARDILIKRSSEYSRMADRNRNDSNFHERLLTMSITYHNAAAILTAALNEDWELLRNYEGA